MNKHDKKHLKRLEAIARMVERIYDAAADDAAAIGAMAMRLGADGEVPFSFDDYPQAKARMDELLSWLRSQLEVVVAEGVAGEWQLSEDKNDELVRRVLGLPDDADPGDMPEPLRRRWMDRNEKGREAFLKRKERGLGLSERVWRGTQSFPGEIAMGIDMGILDGKPAASMARDLKQYLKHPDKLFRRVRDERGILHLSKNAAAFHPGQGVYRSSYQNARRLAVTETNMAYHTADHERWQQLDFVVGIEIHLSGNHTCKGRDGKPHKFEDICDQLKGKYPKDFKFTGWHPHCRCHATSILKTDEEMEEDTRRILRGEEVTGESVNKVTEPPEGFEKWVEKNEGRIAEAKRKGTLAGFVRENENLIEFGENGAKVNSRLSIRQELTDNNRKLMHVLGVTQGEPMTHEMADAHRPNPHYTKGSGDGYTKNCQSSVVAYEMRRQGYDVEALPNTKKMGNGSFELSHDTTKAWIDPSTGRPPLVNRLSLHIYENKDEYEQLSSFSAPDKNFSEFEPLKLGEGRYHLRFQWGEYNGGGGHVVCFEVNKSGKVKFHDPQTGTVPDIATILRKADRHSFEYYRVDNLMANPDVVSGVVAKAGTTKPIKRRTVVDKELTAWKRTYNKWVKAGYTDDEIRDAFRPYFKGDTEFEDKVWSYIKLKGKRLVDGDLNLSSQSELAKQTLEWGRQNVIGKKTYSNQAFGGKVAKFSRNSFTENLRHGSLQEAKIDILMHLDDYLTPNLQLREITEITHGDKTAMYVGKVKYIGSVEELRGNDVELMFKKSNNGDIIFHFIKFI